jgi:hypothetical protein
MLVQVRNYKFRSLPLIYNYLRPIKDTEFGTHTDTRSRAWNAGAPTPAAPPPLSVRPTGRTSSGEDTRAQTLTDTADNRDTRTGRRPGGTQTLPVTPRPIALPQLGSPNRLCIRGHGQKCVSISLISPQLHARDAWSGHHKGYSGGRLSPHRSPPTAMRNYPPPPQTFTTQSTGAPPRLVPGKSFS